MCPQSISKCEILPENGKGAGPRWSGVGVRGSVCPQAYAPGRRDPASRCRQHGKKMPRLCATTPGVSIFQEVIRKPRDGTANRSQHHSQVDLDALDRRTVQASNTLLTP